MQEICDILLLDELAGSSKLLKQLRIFSPTTIFEDGKVYSGFLNLELKRIKAVAILTHFRNNGIRCLNIPIKYKGGLLSEAEARKLAEKHLEGRAEIIDSVKRPGKVVNPMFWKFISNEAPSEPGIFEGGGNVIVDALDGHIWDAEELEEFSYDYLNAL
ncbi:hypothetical protein [Massilia scottii]|uniref:hypothetical protein n=1 Tax=Massilia scottii TaxID=3057166 RepID=UPI002796C595|nr:hypothetical protein [Massilia sp. CCM 9029]MDQ1835534.1 hypothetical protein [Massilia sp. CCM 9029]